MHTPLSQVQAPPADRGESQGESLPVWTLPPSQIPPRRASSPDAFSPHPTQFHGDHFCSFGCIGDLLPVSTWLSVRIAPHADVFLMCLCLEVSSMSFTLPSRSNSTKFPMSVPVELGVGTMALFSQCYYNLGATM